MKDKREPVDFPGSGERNTKRLFTRLKNKIGTRKDFGNRKFSMPRIAEITGYSQSTLEKVNAGIIDLPDGLRQAISDSFGCYLGYRGELLGKDGQSYSEKHYNDHINLSGDIINEDLRLLYAEVTALHAAAQDQGKLYPFWRSFHNWERDVARQLGLLKSAREHLKKGLLNDSHQPNEEQAAEHAAAVFPDEQFLPGE